MLIKWQDRFELEALNLVTIYHTNIISVRLVWRERGTVFYAMNRIEGKELQSPEQEDWQPKSWAEVEPIAFKLLDALEAVHEVNLIHGDVKPSNILLTAKGEPILIDFGTARNLAEFQATLSANTHAYTPGYAPPELHGVEQTKNVTPSADLYSWAITIIGLLTRHPNTTYGGPLTALSRLQSLFIKNKDPYSDLASLLSNVPSNVVEVLQQCIQLDHTKRPSNVAETRSLFASKPIVFIQTSSEDSAFRKKIERLEKTLEEERVKAEQAERALQKEKNKTEQERIRASHVQEALKKERIRANRVQEAFQKETIKAEQERIRANRAQEALQKEIIRANQAQEALQKEIIKTSRTQEVLQQEQNRVEQEQNRANQEALQKERIRTEQERIRRSREQEALRQEQNRVKQEKNISTRQILKVIRNENISLNKLINTSLTSISIGLNWDQEGYVDIDVDAVVFICGSNGQVRNDSDFIFYNNSIGRNSWGHPFIAHLGGVLGDVSGNDGDDQRIMLDLSIVPQDVTKFVFCLTLFEAKTRGQNLGMMKNAFIRVLDKKNQEIMRYELAENMSGAASMIFAELYRHHGEWIFRAISQGFTSELTQLAYSFGVNV